MPKMSTSPDPFEGIYEEDLYNASPEPSRNARASMLAASVSPAASSDKENRSTRLEKGKVRESSANSRQPLGGKRKRAGTADVSNERDQRRRTIEVEDEDEEQRSGIYGEEEVDDEYDPNQDPEERRKLVKGFRGLENRLKADRQELIQSESNGLAEILTKANEFSSRVKQTSDATIDSRLLVNTAELTYRKTLALVAGDGAQGVDVEDFVGRCISYMQRAGNAQPSSTQRRIDEENDEQLNWEHLGRNACLPHILRPSLPGFLLGPLSLEKRARKVAVRRVALKPSSLQETRPEVLRAGDIEKSENENLAFLCKQINLRFDKVLADAQQAADELAHDDMTESQQKALLDDHGISINGGFAYFKFVVNPRSFGQTIENMFYVSFLIRDGHLGLEMDEDDMPFLVKPEPKEQGARTQDGAMRCQAVLALDQKQWLQLIELFDINESVILHREEPERSVEMARGWYA